MSYQYFTFTLPNGLRVIGVPMEGLSSATAIVLVGAGSRYEQKQKAGLSHFLEHMIFKGTHKRPTAFDISSLVDSVGGENNAFTSKDQTGYYIKTQNRHTDLALDILSDTLRDSLFIKEEIEKERGTIIEEINMYEDTPMYDIDDVFYGLIYKGNPLGWSTAGEKETVAQINRDDFVDYTKKFYKGSNMVLAVAGQINEAQLKEMAGKYFSGFEKGEKEEFLPFAENQSQPQVKIKSKKTDQAHLYFGFPSFSFFDTDRPTLSIINAILGGGMSSRLFIQVRERRGLAYYVSSSTDYFQDTGMIAARAGLNIGKTKEAVAVIREEFEKMKTGDVKEEELSRAKEFLKGRTALRMENSQAVADWFAEKQLLEGKIETPQDVFAKIEKVTLEDIKRVAARLFKKEKINLAVIGPFAKDENLLDL